MPPPHPDCRRRMAPPWTTWARERDQVNRRRTKLVIWHTTEDDVRRVLADAVRSECDGIESDFKKVWGSYKVTGKSRRDYDETVNAYLASISDGRVSAEYRAKPEAKEIQAAVWLSSGGDPVRFNRESSAPGSKNPDLTIDGKLWEVKRIETSSLAKAKKRVGSGLSQSQRVIVDLSLETLEKDDEKALVGFVSRLRDVRGLIVLYHRYMERVK